MKIIHSATELHPGSKKVCLAIGFFDGVHLGHQQIIRQTIADARQHDGLALVLTFDQHPNSVVAPDRVPLLIQLLPQRIRAIESLGANALLLLRFDRPFSRQSGESFIRHLARDLGQLQSICVGADFVFGHQRSGNVALLRALGEELRFTVHGIAAVSLDGQVVSSTRIREMIRLGDFDAAGQMLGRSYSLAARVVKGDQLGTKLGFPTANLDVTGLVLPPSGVYAALVRRSAVAATDSTETVTNHRRREGDRREAVPNHRAVLNIGTRPTLKARSLETRFEVHLLDFSGELHGEELEITFVARLREERRFSSLEELKAQIARDILDARGRF
jgi:riboflavin kinase/FMN adenylyltransferase